jgi:CDP-diacylglycerol--serine O-phosphatidyltransferase|tara:strand:- start:5393 stop:6151 length:759 start_codon:yes stop_codon:yes gene_type:complete
MIKSFIPNFLTLLNLICGCFSIAFAFQFQFDAVLILVLMGVLLDFLDGIAARLLNTESNFGKQLDSLSDIVTSGVVPGIVVYQLFKLSGNRVLDFDLNSYMNPIFNLDLVFSISPVAFIAFLITLGSAVRLAKFNTIDYADEFEGLPTPANALFFVALPLLIDHVYLIESKEYLLNNYTLIMLTISSVILMNVPFRLFSLRLSLRKYDYNIFKILTIVLSIPIILLFGLGGFSLVIILYLFLNVIRNLWSLI